MLVENRQFEPTPHLFGAPYGWRRWNFAEIFGVRKLDFLGYRTALFAWSYVWLFWYSQHWWSGSRNRAPDCDRARV